MKRSRFTEAQTRSFYNKDDALYRSFWSKDGNCHWGYFPDTNLSFQDAMAELNKRMLGLIEMNDDSHVLDLGCGNGLNSFFIHEKTRAHVSGIDLSDTRIENAQAMLAGASPTAQNNMRFSRASATNLPFSDAEFTHVWSQATMYHVHQKRKALSEVSRVLQPRGTFVFDDLIKPNPRVSREAEKYVYERLLFNTQFNMVSYQQELQRHKFRVLFAEDLSVHYATSYRKLADILRAKIASGEDVRFHTKYKELITAYEKSAELAEKGDIGWAMFLCRKESNNVTDTGS